MCYKQPQWANQPLASCGVIMARASVMAWSRTSRVRAAFARKMAVNFDQPFSIGDKSGAYGGRYSRRAPTDAMASFTPDTGWEERLSIHTTCPVGHVGARTVSTYVKNTCSSVLPSTVMAAIIPSSESAPKTVIFFPLLTGVEVCTRSP